MIIWFVHFDKNLIVIPAATRFRKSRDKDVPPEDKLILLRVLILVVW